MRVGVTGHQKRAGIDWDWVADALDAELSRRPGITSAMSSLAAGADQVFARCALRHGIRLIAVIPIDDYERFFDPEALSEYDRLLEEAERVDLGWSGDPQTAFLQAGRYVVEHIDLLFAVWDGNQAEGKGGTGDIVSYAQNRGCPVVHINPIDRTITA